MKHFGTPAKSCFIMKCPLLKGKLKLREVRGPEFMPFDIERFWYLLGTAQFSVMLNSGQFLLSYVGLPEKVVNYIKFRSERTLASLKCARLEYQAALN